MQRRRKIITLSNCHAQLVTTHCVNAFIISTMLFVLCIFNCTISASETDSQSENDMLEWSELPQLPDSLGVAGPFVGIHDNALIVAGGANFPLPVWENEKVWHDQIHVLIKQKDNYVWKDGGKLDRPIAYGASVTTPDGIVCIGGNDEHNTYNDVFLLKWDVSSGKVRSVPYPTLPQPCAFTAASLIGDTIYLAGGQSGQSLETAMTNFWSLNLSERDKLDKFRWKELTPYPGPSRALNLTISQHNGFNECLYVISGRRQEGTKIEFLKDVWEYTPETGNWRSRADVPRCVMGGSGVAIGQSHIFVFGGADGSLYFEGNRLKDKHPGFPKEAFAFHTITDSWTSSGPIPLNQVTTTAVKWNGTIVIPSGEVRPRVRSPQIWSAKPIIHNSEFGTFNYVVLVSYLLSMVLVGFYFTNKNRNTDDYFRGGKQIPWWAAGCSIFATMLSSLTFTGIPSKAYAQDWVYLVGNFMIPLVAIVVIYSVLPFYRCIDATSAYEYLEKRFNRSVRIFGSISFIMFHVFRMAVVMSLTGLALAVTTPLTPVQSVLVMGVLSIIYCTMGGIEAVIWTDTIQTFVLLGGAVLAFGLLVAGTENGASGFIAAASEAEKFKIANFHWNVIDTQIALWVIIVGSVAQNISSYTADQAVVQRYMTTADYKLAARSVWVNVMLTIPASILFFGIGTALYVFYRSHPGKLDPTITTDQIFPLFIAREMPVGIAGLIVAAIFAAAQSTASTSMNSIATVIVTDLMRPFNLCHSERNYLTSARIFTFLAGVVGTLFGLMFVNPDITSLFDAFVIVIGLFMGVLGGLFILGMMTHRANGMGAMFGAIVGACVMFYLWKFTQVNGYLYTAAGISTCVISGFAASLLFPQANTDLTGLTLYTLQHKSKK